MKQLRYSGDRGIPGTVYGFGVGEAWNRMVSVDRAYRASVGNELADPT